MKKFVGYLIDKAVRKLPRSKKVSPTIKSVKPTKLSVPKSIEKVRQDETMKRIYKLDDAEKKVQKGKKMMKEGQKTRRQMVDTGTAFQFRHRTSYHSIKPGQNVRKEYKGTIADDAGRTPTKKFKTGKQLAKEKKEDDAIAKEFGIRFKKAGGGMMGRRFGMKKGSPFKKETNVDKIKKTFAPKRKKKFPDLTGDGKVTFADILKGRGVINGKKKKA
jgi:hypothetical protein